MAQSPGALPYAGVILDASGNLYGTTTAGGTLGWGVVYELNSSGAEKVLYNFTGGSNGGAPYGVVIRDSAGDIYGTTAYGRNKTCAVYGAGCGVVYKLSPSGKETVRYTFTGGADGGVPLSGLVRDSTGYFYGTTLGGGDPACYVPTDYTSQGCGVVYKMSPQGIQTVLHIFTGGSDGAAPYGGVIRDSSGNLYGTTYGGGTYGFGVIYRIDPSGSETILYNFGALVGDPVNPESGVIRDAAGNLYGTTFSGGAYGNGTVYKLTTTGVLKLLHSFQGMPDGQFPVAGLIRDPSGNFYGTTENGGTGNFGCIYKVTPSGQESVLHSLTVTDGAYPYAGLTRDSSGNLYGTTWNDGNQNCGYFGGCGTVFKLVGSTVFTVLFSF
jgi:uncharacterized repeat protein (TIGR03803 family)